MSWMKTAVMDAGPFIRMVNVSVQARKHLGFKEEHAFDDAAQALALTPRRVRAARRQEFWRVPVDQYHRLVRRWWMDMERQAAALHAEANRLEQQAEAAWLAENQLSLPLEEPCSTPSSPNSTYGVRGGY